MNYLPEWRKPHCLLSAPSGTIRLTADLGGQLVELQGESAESIYRARMLGNLFMGSRLRSGSAQLVFGFSCNVTCGL